VPLDVVDELKASAPPMSPGFARTRRRSEAHAGRAIFVREAIVELGTSRARHCILHRWHRGSVSHDRPARGTEGGTLPRC
jgi:hypothetical protein